MEDSGDLAVSYLIKASKRLPSDLLILKSHYLTQCRQYIALRSTSVTEKKLGVNKLRCPKCSLEWKHITNPLQPNLCTFCKNKTQERGKNNDQNDKIQIKSSTITNTSNTIANSTNSKKDKNIPSRRDFLLAPSKDVLTYKKEPNPPGPVTTIKKKKKKDKFAGLSQAVVLAVQKKDKTGLESFLKSSK